jgi:hypothetical protein
MYKQNKNVNLRRLCQNLLNFPYVTENPVKGKRNDEKNRVVVPDADGIRIQ